MIMQQLYKMFFYDQNATILSIQILDFVKEIDYLKTNFLEKNEYPVVPLQHHVLMQLTNLEINQSFFWGF